MTNAKEIPNEKPKSPKNKTLTEQKPKICLYNGETTPGIPTVCAESGQLKFQPW